MLSCSVSTCKITSDNDPTMEFFLFPKDLKLRCQWIVACGLDGTQIDFHSDVICSLHFDETAYEEIKHVDGNLTYVTRKIKKGIVPTENLPENEGENIWEIPAASTVKKRADEVYKFNRANYIKTRAQLDEIKNSNFKLLKSIEDVTGELESWKEIYQDRIKENISIKKQLKQYTKHIYTKERTKQILSKVFSDMQIKVLMGQKKGFWSDDDMAVGYTIKHLSNITCYNYIIKNMNIPLPGLSSIKRWINVKNLGNKPKKKQRKLQNKDKLDKIKSEEDIGIKEENTDNEENVGNMDDEHIEEAENIEYIDDYMEEMA